MIDITEKYPGLRRATAEARLILPEKARIALESKTVPKGDVREFSRAAAMLGVKNTPHLLPFCHPINVDYTDLDWQIEGDELILRLTVAALDRTGVEVEAMTGVAVAALNAYDMLKPVAEGVEIGHIRLLEKKGGKGQFQKDLEGLSRPVGVRLAVLSDSVAAGKKKDRAGAGVQEILSNWPVEIVNSAVLTDDPQPLLDFIADAVLDERTDLVISMGGTGLGPRDLAVQTVRSILDREIEGVGEWIRAYGGKRTPLATLSNALCGLKGKTLILCLPGSSRGARESIEGLLPWLFHLLRVVEKGYQHQGVDNS